MATELWYLFLTSVLLAMLWIPHIYGQAKTAGPLTPEDYRVGRDIRDAKFPPWVRRADRAHVNLVEQFGAFAGLVLVAHLTGANSALTAWSAATFFWARVAHAVIYLSGYGRFFARTVAFLVAFIALLVFAVAILVHQGASAAA